VLVPVLLRKDIRARLFRLHDARKARRNDDALDFRLGSGRLERVQGALDGRVDQVLVRVRNVEVERRGLVDELPGELARKASCRAEEVLVRSQCAGRRRRP
jgi:hypothetical protein